MKVFHACKFQLWMVYDLYRCWTNPSQRSVFLGLIPSLVLRLEDSDLGSHCATAGVRIGVTAGLLTQDLPKQWVSVFLRSGIMIGSCLSFYNFLTSLCFTFCFRSFALMLFSAFGLVHRWCLRMDLWLGDQLRPARGLHRGQHHWDDQDLHCRQGDSLCQLPRVHWDEGVLERRFGWKMWHGHRKVQAVELSQVFVWPPHRRWHEAQAADSWHGRLAIGIARLGSRSRCSCGHSRHWEHTRSWSRHQWQRCGWQGPYDLHISSPLPCHSQCLQRSVGNRCLQPATRLHLPILPGESGQMDQALQAQLWHDPTSRGSW